MRCLQHNRSCSRAWELLGAIAEREQAHQDAASHYAHAWQLSAQTNTAVGYKLAASHLWTGRHVDAICVAAEVLRADPGCSQIRTDVLDKARASLRP